MNNSQKLMLFWKITKRINKKFCNNKLKINNIILFRKGDLHKSFPEGKGWYFSDKKIILIRKDESLVEQIKIICHELAHAYQHQILKNKGRLKHNKKGGKICQNFLKETDKILKIQCI